MTVEDPHESCTDKKRDPGSASFLIFATPGEGEAQRNRLTGVGHPSPVQTATSFGLVAGDEGDNVAIMQKVLDLSVG
jgi:hypothetical protein